MALLHIIRDRATGWVAYLIILLISVPFALWGIGEYLGFGGGPEVAEVNGQAIEITAFNEAYQTRRSRQLREGAPPTDLEESLKFEILNELVNRELVTQYLDNQHITVPDSMLMKVIHNTEIFQQDGKFDPQRYHQILRANRLDPRQFEATERHRLRVTLMQDLLASSILATEAEVRERVRLHYQSRGYRSFNLPLANFAEPEAVTDEQIAEYYQNAREEFTTPEQVKVSYLELRLDSMIEAEALSEETLRRYHENHALNFMQPELRRLRQIFLPPSEEAEAQAEQLRERLVEEDFADLAREHSKDSLSHDRGGEVGWVAEDDLAEDLGLIVFNLQSEVVSEPIVTDRGVYLLEILEVQDSSIRAFEEVREQVQQQAGRANLEQRYAAAREELAVLVYEHPESLQPAAERLGIEVQSTDWYAVDKPPVEVLQASKVTAALRQTEVLQERLNSDRIDIDESYTVAVRVDDYKEERMEALEEVQETIREMLANAAAREKMLVRAREILEELRGGEAFMLKAARDGEGTAIQPNVTRSMDDIPLEIRRRVFSMTPESGTVGAAIQEDGAVMIMLDEVNDNPDQVATENEINTIRTRILSQEVLSIQAALRGSSDVVLYPERIQ